jgi:RHS repeat-associated protein
MTGYLYAADGTRVAKGTISIMSCDPTASGFQTVTDYALGLGNQQVTEVGVNGSSLAWQHTNVWTPGGQLIATFNAAESGTAALHFYFDDPLGTRRVQTNAIGVIEQQCTSLPFGDQESCIPMPTEQLFTGKERDTESGNDYFEARYYSSSMGRFMSPDWAAKAEPVPYANLEDPQSLNLYAYAGNNPLARADADGHFWEEMANLWKWGHYVNNAGLDAALQKEADADRKEMAGWKGFTINGKSPAEAAKGSNQEVILADRAGFEYMSSAAMGSKQMIGGFLVMGIVDPAAGAEEAVASGSRAIGLGITGTKAATTVAERLAIEAAESNPAAGKVLQTTLKDARWPASQGWVKMESRSPGGVVVHWVRNTITGEAADFKLK